MIEDRFGTWVAGTVRLLMGTGMLAGLAFITMAPMPSTDPAVTPSAKNGLLTVDNGEIRSGVLSVTNEDYSAEMFRTVEHEISDDRCGRSTPESTGERGCTRQWGDVGDDRGLQA